MASASTVPTSPRSWSLGPLPAKAPEAGWSLPDITEVPDDERYTTRRGRAGALALLVVLLGALGFALVWSDPWGLGWSARVTPVTARLEPWVDRSVSALVRGLR